MTLKSAEYSQNMKQIRIGCAFLFKQVALMLKTNLFL